MLPSIPVSNIESGGGRREAGSPLIPNPSPSDYPSSPALLPMRGEKGARPASDLQAPSPSALGEGVGGEGNRSGDRPLTRYLLTHKTALAGLIVFLLIATIAILAPAIAPHDPLQQ